MMLIASASFANSSDADIDKLINEHSQQTELAKKLSTSEIISKIMMLHDLYEDKPLEFGLKAAPFGTVISERSKKGDLEAAYYQYAFFDRLICENLTNLKMSYSLEVCNEMIGNLKSLATSESKKNVFYIASAKRVLGDIYKNGNIVSQSNMLSTEWYYKAAKDFYGNGNRDAAITSLEKALKIMPDYPPALALRKLIFGY